MCQEWEVVQGPDVQDLDAPHLGKGWAVVKALRVQGLDIPGTGCWAEGGCAKPSLLCKCWVCKAWTC